MERHLYLLFGFVVGFSFMFVPINEHVFESFTGVLSGFFNIVGLLIVTILGFIILFRAILSLK
jgi:hypothetical protein